jgi:hypothetical protein
MYQNATTLSQRPSQLAEIDDAWTAYQFDSAVVYFGIVISNALQERVNVGSDDRPDWKSKYTLSQLLADGFALENSEESDMDLQGIDGIGYDEVS